MQQDKKDNLPEQGENNSEKFIDKVAKDKIDRHLSDVNDTISEEDIKNINTDISSPELPDKDKEKPDDKPLPEEKKTEDPKNDKGPLLTSWNVLE